jgi:hypothetical protein
MATETFKGQVTPEQINAWKEKYTDIYALKVKGWIGYVRRPGRRDISFATLGSNEGKDGLRFNEIMLKSIWLGGAEEIKNIDELFLGVSKRLSEIVAVAEVELEKL